MTYRVEINDCLKQFHRAHEALIDSLGGSYHIASTTRRQGQSHWDILEHNWRKLYRANPIRENSTWIYLDFDCEKHYTMFILQWS